MGTGPLNLSDVLASARTSLRKGDCLAAIAALRTALNASPQSADALELMGIAQSSAGNHHAAREAFAAATEADPRRASAHYNYALALDRGGYLDEALEELNAALFIKPEYPSAAELKQKVTRRVRERNWGADEGFALVGSRPSVGAESGILAGKIECLSCGEKNAVTARTCTYCGSLLPEMDAIIPVE